MPSLKLQIFINSLLILLAQPTPLGVSPKKHFIIWNVGYGEWSTWVGTQECVHFGIGGEKFQFNKNLLQACLNKINKVNLTHIDQHHLNFFKHYRRLFAKSCPPMSYNKKHILSFMELKDKNCHVFLSQELCVLQGFYWQGEHLAKPQSPHCRHIGLLSGHGSKKYLNHKNIQAWLKFKVLVSSKKYKKKVHDLQTERLFKQYGRKLVYSYKWGHLVFQLPNLTPPRKQKF